MVRFVQSVLRFVSPCGLKNANCYTLQVLLDKLALDKEKHTLLQENQQLRAILKQYLDGKLFEFK